MKLPKISKQNLKQNIIKFILIIVLILIMPYIMNVVNLVTGNTGNNIGYIRENSFYNPKNGNYTNAIKTEYVLAKVDYESSTKLTQEVESPTGQKTNYGGVRQEVAATITGSGEKQGDKVNFTAYNDGTTKNMPIKVGDEVVLRLDPKLDNPQESFVSYKSKYRIGGLIVVGVLFLVLIFALAGLKGINAILGLVFTVQLIQTILLPGLVTGIDPLLLTIIVSGLASTVSLLIAHGWNKRTMVAVFSTLIVLVITIFLSQWVVDILQLTGYGDEATTDLKQNNQTYFLNLQGLLLSGIIIGTLGILDDITTAQASVVEQLSRANPTLDPKQLFWRSLEVGKEHVISLINTLALAYIGTSLPMILTFVVFDFAPLWVIFNNEIIIEELARSLVGSACLMLAIPIAAFLASIHLRTDLKLPNRNFSFKESIESQIKN
jgi:uncharacterized membrane protein